MNLFKKLIFRKIEIRKIGDIFAINYSEKNPDHQSSSKNPVVSKNWRSNYRGSTVLDRMKCWPIHILSFDFLYPFIAGCQTNITVNSLNTKRTSSLEKSLSEKYVNIPGCQKNRAFHIRILKNRVMHILFVEKKGGQSYNWQRWKKGHSARTSVLWHI